MATNRNIIYMLKRNEVCYIAVTYNSVMLFDNYSGITLRNTNLSTSNTQAPMPRLIIGYQEIPQLFNQVVVNNSCSELWEVHGFCYKCINTGAHCLLCSIKTKQVPKRVK